MSTLTVYGDTADGMVNSMGANGYDAVKAGTGDLEFWVNTTGATCSIGQQYAFGDSGDPDYIPWESDTIGEAFISFDTSSIGAGSTVSAAVLTLTSAGGNTNFTLQARLHDWGATLTTADWLYGASLSGTTLLAHRAMSGGWTIGTAYDLTDDALAANVSKTGSTRIILVSANTVSATRATAGEMAGCYLADQAGTTSDPKLVVTYSAGGGAVTKSRGWIIA